MGAAALAFFGSKRTVSQQPMSFDCNTFSTRFSAITSNTINPLEKKLFRRSTALPSKPKKDELKADNQTIKMLTLPTKFVQARGGTAGPRERPIQEKLEKSETSNSAEDGKR